VSEFAIANAPSSPILLSTKFREVSWVNVGDDAKALAPLSVIPFSPIFGKLPCIIAILCMKNGVILAKSGYFSVFVGRSIHLSRRMEHDRLRGDGQSRGRKVNNRQLPSMPALVAYWTAESWIGSARSMWMWPVRMATRLGVCEMVS